LERRKISRTEILSILSPKPSHQRHPEEMRDPAYEENSFSLTFSFADSTGPGGSRGDPAAPTPIRNGSAGHVFGSEKSSSRMRDPSFVGMT